jgi:hypothetical protein
MRVRTVILGAIATIAVASTSFVAGVSLGQDKSARVYELRTYTTLPGRLPALNKRFADHTMKFFEKHGMRNESYWLPADDPAGAGTTLVYLLSHASREAADVSWKAFQADPEWLKVRDASEADGKILAKAPERQWLVLTAYSPAR